MKKQHKEALDDSCELLVEDELGPILLKYLGSEAADKVERLSPPDKKDLAQALSDALGRCGIGREMHG
jgi:hypothetical protein